MGTGIFDLIIIITLALFTLRGISNGLIGEVAGIAALLGGFWAARAWNAKLAPYLSFISDPSGQQIAACVIIFIAVMLAIGFIAKILKKIASYSFVGWIDKLGGAILGFAKGLLLWTLLFIVLVNIFHDAPFLRDSQALPYFQAIIAQIQPWLPPELASKLAI